MCYLKIPENSDRQRTRYMYYIQRRRYFKNKKLRDGPDQLERRIENKELFVINKLKTLRAKLCIYLEIIRAKLKEKLSQ